MNETTARHKRTPHEPRPLMLGGGPLLPRRRGGAGDPVRHQRPRAPDDGRGVPRRLPGIALPPVVNMAKPTAWRCPRPPSRGQGQAELGDLGRERRQLDCRRHGRRVPHRYRHRGSRGRRLHFDIQVRGSRRVPGGDASREKRPGRLRGCSGRDRLRWHRRCRVDPALSDARRPRAALVSVRGRGRRTGSDAATGSTYLRSNVTLALYNPDATPAVVNVSVSTGSALTYPSAFQGLVVPASGGLRCSISVVGPPAEDGGRDGHRRERGRGRRSARDELGERRRRLHRREASAGSGICP